MKVATLPRPATRIRPRARVHRCFELSARIQLDDPTWTLIHGTIGGWIEHAWLRRGDVVYDAVCNESYTVEDYAKKFSAEELGRYDLKAACAENGRTGWFGFLPKRPKTPESERKKERLRRVMASRAKAAK